MKASRLLVSLVIALSCHVVADDAYSDPWEGLNRELFAVHEAVDRSLLTPVAKTWQWVVPKPIDRSIDHFFTNLTEPRNSVNSLLQGQWKSSWTSVSRFAINSTIGVFGFWDPASRLGLNLQSEDFGQTLGVWGMPSGPYLFLPLLGPGNVRDWGGRIVDLPLAPTTWVQTPWVPPTLLSISAVQTRAHLLDLEALMMGDRYLSVRSLYWQSRHFATFGSEWSGGESNIDDYFEWEGELIDEDQLLDF